MFLKLLHEALICQNQIVEHRFSIAFVTSYDFMTCLIPLYINVLDL